MDLSQVLRNCPHFLDRFQDKADPKIMQTSQDEALGKVPLTSRSQQGLGNLS